MQTGFVGLGAMGAHMARSLHRAGLLTGVWNRTAEKSTALAAELKVIAFKDLEELAGNCEAVSSVYLPMMTCARWSRLSNRA
jgi:3-hydroxyisobutyrate dehydrogenase